MIAHLVAKKVIALGVVAGGAYLVNKWWHGSGKPAVTPHGSTVTPSGKVVTPPAPVPGGTNPSSDTNTDDSGVSTSTDVVDYTNPTTAYTSVESNTATTPALGQAYILDTSIAPATSADTILTSDSSSGDSSPGDGTTPADLPPADTGSSSIADDILSGVTSAIVGG